MRTSFFRTRCDSCEVEHGVLQPREKLLLRFVRGDPNRLAEIRRADHWRDEESALGHRTMKIVQPHGNHFGFGTRGSQMEDAGLERQQLAAVAARSFGKENQGIA